jgi:hypothetical protein
MTRYDDETLLEEIERLAAEFGRPPTLQEMRNRGEYGASTYYSRFGSWREALEAAGYESRPPQSEAEKSELIEEMQRVGELVGHAPSTGEMNEYGNFWASTYKNHFDSWADALESAGYEPRDKWRGIERSELRAALVELGEELGKRPTYQEMEEQGEYDSSTYVREYGSWKAALEAAGYEPPSAFSEGALVADLREFAEEIGKRPSQREMTDDGPHSHTTYVRHFGTWTSALEAAFEDEE